MIKHDKYKLSGLKYFDEIPFNWSLKRLCDIVKGGQNNFTGGPFGSDLKFNDYTNDGVRIIQLQNIGIGEFLNDYKIYTSEKKADELFSCNIFPGDIIISKMAEPVARATILPDIEKRYVMSSDGIRLVVSKNHYNKYLVYAINSIHFNFYAVINSFGSTRLRIGLNTLKKLNLILPNYDEQLKITNYLETKTQAIDKKINQLSQKTNYYKEYRKSLINDTVCKGLDKKVRLKDSGVVYIKAIPQHWKSERIKDIFNIGRGRVIGQELLVENGTYPVYSSQTENNGCLGYIETYDFDTDLLTWTTDGANAGTVFRRSGKFNCTNVCGTLIPKRKNLDLDYVVYALQESASHNKRIDTNGAKIMNNEMGVIHIAFPPLSEQTAIANYLDQKTQTIDKIINNINNQIVTLKELRKTLINDVVTGKIKVTD